MFEILSSSTETPTDSGFRVPYTTILSVGPHSNADRLSIVTVYGFQVITQKGKFKVGDKVFYIPIDSILSQKLEDLLFAPDSKIKPIKRRIKQIRLRGLASQGMLIDPKEVASIVNAEYLTLEQDVGSILGVTKYEPPESGPAQTMGAGNKGRKKLAHPDFMSYNGLGNIKWFPTLFQDGDEVVIQEKVHGTNARAALLPFRANTLFKKIQKWFGFAPEVEKLYGSNRVDITNASTYSGYYGIDIYGATFEKLDVFSKLKLGETVFGEIIGPKVQKNYEYGLKEHKFLLFDVKVMQPDGKQIWLTPDEVEAFAKERGLEMVPILYKGPFNKELTYSMTKGPSVFHPGTLVREGVAIKAKTDYSKEGNKVALKWVSEDYLASPDNTDFH